MDREETTRASPVRRALSRSAGTLAALTGASLGGATPRATTSIPPFRVAIPQQPLDDLRRRLDQVRGPDKEPDNDRSQSVPQGTARSLADYWPA